MLTPEQQRRACLEVLIRRTWPDAVAQSRRIQGKLTAASDHEQIEEILRMTSEPRWSTLKEIVKVHEDSHKKQDTLKAHITAGEEKKASNTARVAVATKKIHALEAERKTLEEVRKSLFASVVLTQSKALILPHVCTELVGVE